MRQTNKDLVTAIIAAMIDRPSDFTIGEHTIDDKKSGMRFWIANGIFWGGVYKPFEKSFGIIQSIRFHRAVNQLKILKAQISLAAGSDGVRGVIIDIPMFPSNIKTADIIETIDRELKN